MDTTNENTNVHENNISDSEQNDDIMENLSNELIYIDMPTFDDLSTTQLKQVIRNYRLHVLLGVQNFTKKTRQELLEICNNMFIINKEGIKLKVNEPITFKLESKKKQQKNKQDEPKQEKNTLKADVLAVENDQFFSNLGKIIHKFRNYFESSTIKSVRVSFNGKKNTDKDFGMIASYIKEKLTDKYSNFKTEITTKNCTLENIKYKNDDRLIEETRYTLDDFLIIFVHSLEE